ncbi:MAG: 30S ribosomal protein S8 [Candidatus Margulisiibacteriota bacterium]
MTIQDPIGDMFLRIKNAIMIKEERIEMPSSKTKARIAELRKNEGYINNFEITAKGARKVLKLTLKYAANKKSLISGIKRISKPSRHLYAGSKNIPFVQSGYGCAIISTSQGLMTDAAARKKKVGGEIICHIW